MEKSLCGKEVSNPNIGKQKCGLKKNHDCVCEYVPEKSQSKQEGLMDFIGTHETTSKPACVQHEDSGFRCLVLHPDHIQCKQCSKCYVWYR